jgi:hypothetical protein
MPERSQQGALGTAQQIPLQKRDCAWGVDAYDSPSMDS